jgi:hypothetical protein
MDNEIKKKKYYIYENIDKLKDHNQIINLIKLENCKFTENGNGIFLNISTLETNIINIIYQILMNTLEYKEEMGGHFITEFDCNNEYPSNEGSETVTIKNNHPFSSEDLRLENYSKEEQEIITYSKKYKL